MEILAANAADGHVPMKNGIVRADDDTLAARVQKLEQAVFGIRASPLRVSADENHPSTTTFTPSPTAARVTTLRADSKVDDEDVHLLEAVAASPEWKMRRFTLTILSVEETLNTIDQRLAPPCDISIPSYDVVVACLDAYSHFLDAMQHIMHMPDSRRMIAHNYAQMQSRHHVEPGATAFILSLCATVAFHWTTGFRGSLEIFENSASALKLSNVWAGQALVAMEQARLASAATLEAVQASALLTFLFYHMEGFTYRMNIMHVTSIAMARDLGLHNTDKSNSRPRDTTQAATIATEVRRRLWWYLTCTDW